LVDAIKQTVAATLCTVRPKPALAPSKIKRQDDEPSPEYDTKVGGMSAGFVWLNRGKESAGVDLESELDSADGVCAAFPRPVERRIKSAKRA
jgi:itaconate CoA-transferase